MKLAEALAERADCQKKAEKLKERIVNCVRVQEGDRPSEDPNALLKDLHDAHGRVTQLVTRINRTNARTELAPGTSLSDALAERDRLVALRTHLTRVVEAAVIRTDRMTRSEVRFVLAVSVGDLQKEIDGLAQEHRTLDTRIQELNWSTERYPEYAPSAGVRQGACRPRPEENRVSGGPKSRPSGSTPDSQITLKTAYKRIVHR